MSLIANESSEISLRDALVLPRVAKLDDGQFAARDALVDPIDSTPRISATAATFRSRSCMSNTLR